MLRTETFFVYALFQLKYISNIFPYSCILQLRFTVALSVKGINLSAEITCCIFFYPFMPDVNDNDV